MKITCDIESEGVAKVAALQLIGQGAHFTHCVVAGKFVFMFEDRDEYKRAFPKGTDFRVVNAEETT